MTIVLQGQLDRASRLAAAHPAALVISVGIDLPRVGAPVPTAIPVAEIGVSVRDEALARRLVEAMTAAVVAAETRPPAAIDVVRLRSRRGLELLRDRLQGAMVVVPVTARNLRRVGEIVEAVRAAGARGVQLVWDGCDPPREAAEARVFAILEEARATPKRAPVVLSRGEEPVEALRILVDRRC
jgi:hypothetical protein